MKWWPFLGLIVLLGFFNIVPAEDAFISFRYAQNLGQGLVYNHTPVEGATSILWVLYLGVMNFLGYGIPTTAQVTGLLATLCIIFILLKGDAGAWKATVFAMSPAVIWFLSGFEAPVYALSIVLWLVLHEKKQYTWLAVLTFFMGLLRPESVLLTGLLYVVDYKNYKEWLKPFLWYVGIGAVYFIARAWYFGELLPNTFLVKSGFTLAFENYFPFYLVALLFMRNHKFAWVLFLFPLFYLSIEQWQNIGWRFQYPVLAGLLYLYKSPTVEEDGLWPVLKSVGKTPVFSALAIILMLASYQGKDTHEDGRAEIGSRLKKYRVEGESPWMLVTEAGWLPYHSEWNAIDAVGLNDRYIAKNGLDWAYLDLHDIRVIMFHAYTTKDSPVMVPGDVKFNAVVRGCVDYAKARGFTLVAITGSPGDNYWWFTKDVPIEVLRDICYANVPYQYRAIP